MLSDGVNRFQSYALKATVVLLILMLQKPSAKSKMKDHIASGQTLNHVAKGDLQDLVRTIQRWIPKPTRGIRNQEHIARSFANLMLEGNTEAAIRLLTDNPQACTLRLDDRMESNRTVRDVRYSRLSLIRSPLGPCSLGIARWPHFRK